MGGEVTAENETPMTASAGRLSAIQVDMLLERLGQLIKVLSANGAASSPEAVLDTLTRLEQRDLQSFNALDMFATALKSVSNHLSHLRSATHTANGNTAATLEVIVQRLAGLEEKLDEAGQQPSAWPFESETLANALAAIADRLERVEAKVDRAAQQPALEPEATSSLLNAIAERVSRMEGKVDSGADGTSIAACLMAVDRRLSGIESRLGMERPLPAVKETIPEETPLPPPPLPVIEGTSRERVDQLLEQVFRVLSR